MAKGKKTGGGSRAGVPNRATTDVRLAIAGFAEDNAPKVSLWLGQVANGIPPVFDADGNLISKGVEPDPGKALDLYLKAIEYHIPKLARSEVTGPGGEPLMQAPVIHLTLTK